ncbi:MAG: hemolysin family protein [Candidatus Marinimicrobia bacterium]|nr:hemolysin family protein [Candidatus Neomarinimicrobiota bacterium]MCF7840289.1 hemolysin family protein [Candidatus Neomarinimicrobiota bacterium]
MDVTLIIQIAAFILLFLLSFFFSGSETALFSLKNADLERLKHDLAPSSRLIVRLMHRPKRLLITILTGNTIVNVVLAAMAATITVQLAIQMGWNQAVALSVETLILTIIIVLFSEITPKVLAIRNSLDFSSRVVWLISIITRFLSPLANLLYGLVQGLVNWLGIRPEEAFVSDDEIKTLVELGQDKGVIGDEEKEMIHSLIEFGDTVSKEVMIPRPDMVVMHTDMTRAEILDTIRETGYSKFPLYKERIDNILGIVFIKDLLPYLHSTTNRVNLERLARPALFVPEGQPIDELLRTMQHERQKIAMVVDEYGGISGMVAVEDIIEEVLGDLQDEMDENEPEEIQRLGPDAFLVESGTNLDELAQQLDVNFPGEKEYDTLGGFVYDVLGQIPQAGDYVDFDGYRFEVLSVENRRIQQIKVIKRNSSNAVND